MGAAVVAIILRKEKDMVEAFRSAGAVSPPRARSPGELGVEDGGSIFRRLREREVLREAAPGAYYLDEPVWAAVRRMRGRMALAMVLLTLVFIAILFVTASRR